MGIAEDIARRSSGKLKDAKLLDARAEAEAADPERAAAERAFVEREAQLRRAAAARGVIVVTGPPGGGKSVFIRETLLPRLVAAGKRVALLEHKFAQEFGTAALGDCVEFLAWPDAKGAVFDFGSGCICCSPRGDLERRAREFLEEAEKREEAVDTLVLETTGVADAALFESCLRKHFGRRGVVAFVGPHGGPPRGLEEVARAQLDAAVLALKTGPEKDSAFYGASEKGTVFADAGAFAEACLKALAEADPKRAQAKREFPEPVPLGVLLTDGPPPSLKHDRKCVARTVLVAGRVERAAVEGLLERLAATKGVHRVKVAARTYDEMGFDAPTTSPLYLGARLVDSLVPTALFGDYAPAFGVTAADRPLELRDARGRVRDGELGTMAPRDPARLFVLLDDTSEETASSLDVAFKDCAAPKGYEWLCDRELNFSADARVAAASRRGVDAAVFFNRYGEFFYAREAECPFGEGCDLSRATVLEDIDESDLEKSRWRCRCEKHGELFPIEADDGTCVPITLGDDGAIYVETAYVDARANGEKRVRPVRPVDGLPNPPKEEEEDDDDDDDEEAAAPPPPPPKREKPPADANKGNRPRRSARVAKGNS